MSLNRSSFPSFFAAVHGMNPFAWQVELADRVLSEGWPAEIALPTAAGKTAAIDVAAFAMAVAATKGTTAPRRVFFVVDRRVVVDEAFQRARRLAAAITGATGGIVADVREALAGLGGETPLRAARLRGGVAPDDGWARTPCQPVICCSTVDQVGSRLLFRAYGRGRRFGWSIPAGLVGTDSLVLLDEAHLSAAFLQTLELVGSFSGGRERELGEPLRVCAMTATPRSDANRNRFAPPPSMLSEPPLRERLGMRKLATVELVRVPRDSAKDPRAARAVERALELTQPGEVCGVVLNRVDRARAAFEGLRKRGEDAILLTGRSRAVDRDTILERWWPLIRAGREAASPDTNRRFVVATQCVEAGADIDFDRLITDSAAIDALRQRFGRLCRLGRGERGTAEAEVRAVILVGEGEVDDPVYGTALAATNAWLTGMGATGPVDFGVEALGALLPGEEALLPLCSPPGQRPVLLPAHLDVLCQTSTALEPDIDVAPFLHGPSRGPADVTLVWRGDLGDDEGAWVARVALCPPQAGEGLALAPWTVRRWTADVSDAEGERLPDDDLAGGRRGVSPARRMRCLRWRGRDDSEVIGVEDARPGDLLVLPSSHGGCDEFGWSPGFAGPTTDVADEAYAAAGRGLRVRLLSLPGEEGQELPEVHDEAAVTRFLTALSGARAGRARLAAALASRPHRVAWDDDREQETALLALAPPTREDREAADAGETHTTDEEGGEYAQAITLAAHSRDVASTAKRLARHCRLPDDVVSDITLAAWLHDAGKADPRFQVLLRLGDTVGAELGPALAKGLRARGAQAARRAASVAGYPPGGRHELLSAKLAEGARALESATDRDLVLHLISSHHGRCRPFAPAVSDTAQELVELTAEVPGGVELLSASSATGLGRLDSGVAERFWRLTRRYGWWGLAYLEAILRLADHRASEAESTGGAA